jgi:hypothetical protein
MVLLLYHKHGSHGERDAPGTVNFGQNPVAGAAPGFAGDATKCPYEKDKIPSHKYSISFTESYVTLCFQDLCQNHKLVKNR